MKNNIDMSYANINKPVIGFIQIVIDTINNYYLDYKQNIKKELSHFKVHYSDSVLLHNGKGIDLLSLKIKNSNLNQKNAAGNIPMAAAIINYETNNLKLQENHWDYLIHHSALNTLNKNNEDILMLIFKNNFKIPTLSEFQMVYLMDHCSHKNIESNLDWQTEHKDGYNRYLAYKKKYKEI